MRGSSQIEVYAPAQRGAQPATRESHAPDFDQAERRFAELLELDGLDRRVRASRSVVRDFEQALDFALETMRDPSPSSDASSVAVADAASCQDAARLFLQRVLYRINRLKLFWYDDLRRYTNERSSYVREVRDRVEAVWQEWELSQMDAAALRGEDVREGLLRRAAEDVAPPPSPDGLYFRDEVGEAGYRRLLAIASLDGLVEASQLSRTLGGVSNGVHAIMTRLLVEEYGGGRQSRKHSSFFASMLSELGMSTEPEAYFELVPWEVLAAINHSFLLSERKRFYLRYVGGLLYTETAVPAAFDNYRAAAERLGMSDAARGYWELHIKEDERHGRWMLQDVALPLVEMYPAEAWELMLGYDQQKFLSDRAGAAVTRAARAADREAVANGEAATQSEVMTKPDTKPEGRAEAAVAGGA